MPEELATRATLMLIGGIVTGAAAAPLAAWLWRLAKGLKSGSAFGTAVGLAVFGAGMAWVASDMAAVVLERRGHAVVQGELLRFEAVVLRDGSRGSRKVTGAAPVVAFKSPDGAAHLVRGLGGSLARAEIGSAVSVVVNPRDPALSVVGDFQSLHGALWLFGTFAVVPLLAALHNGAHALIERAEAQANKGRRTTPVRATAWAAWRDSARGQHWRTQFRRGAVLTLVLGLVGMFVGAEFMDVGRAMALALAAAASAMVWAGVAAALKPQARPVMAFMAFSGWAIGAVGVGLLAAFLWTLTGPG